MCKHWEKHGRSGKLCIRDMAIIVQGYHSTSSDVACLMQNIEVHYSNSSSPKGEAGLLSRPELEQMITWETNNLYEYLKDLYDRQHADLADYNRSAALHRTVASNKDGCLLMSLLVLPI